jgi:hypothetical protein
VTILLKELIAQELNHPSLAVFWIDKGVGDIGKVAVIDILNRGDEWFLADDAPELGKVDCPTLHIPEDSSSVNGT